MKLLLSRALAEVVNRDADVRIELLSPGKNGQLVLQARGAGDPSWFAFGESGLVDLDPFNDPLLPFSGQCARQRESEPMKLLAYRPGRRMVLRCGRTGRTRIEKAYRSGRLEKSLLRHCIAHRALAGVGLAVPDLLDRDEHLARATFEDLAGFELSLAPVEQDRFARLGHALRRFQENGSQEGRTGLELHGVKDELALLDRVAGSVAELCGPVYPHWTLARRKLAQLGSALEPCEPVLVHRDFHDGQLLDLRPGTGLIDFDCCAMGDSALDAANLIAHLELRVLQGVRGATEESAKFLSRSLLSGLARQNEPGFHNRLAFWRAATFMRLAWIYHLRPPWLYVCEELGRRADQCLEGVAHGSC